MVNTWGALFKGIIPYNNPNFTIYNTQTIYSQYINSANYLAYLNNLKAQIMAFTRCALLGGTIDAMESLFSIAMNQPYVTTDGIVINFDSGHTWIESNGIITEYAIGPKTKFKQPNTPIQAYEAIGECPVRFYSWQTDPARFTQQLLCNNAANLYLLLSLLADESPTALYFDMPRLKFDDISGTITFDFGIMPKPGNAFTSSPNYVPPTSSLVNDFTAWANATLSPTIYEMLKNVTIAEIPDATNTIGVDIAWASSILEFFRPLHSKYFIVELPLPS
jgi:hypothetical protein